MIVLIFAAVMNWLQAHRKFSYKMKHVICYFFMQVDKTLIVLACFDAEMQLENR